MLDVSRVPQRIGHYLAGFTDGEGSFNVSFRRRGDYAMPWRVSLCFNVSQRDQAILRVFKEKLKCGTMRSRADGLVLRSQYFHRDRRERDSVLWSVRLSFREEATRFCEVQADRTADSGRPTPNKGGHRRDPRDTSRYERRRCNATEVFGGLNPRVVRGKRILRDCTPGPRDSSGG